MPLHFAYFRSMDVELIAVCLLLITGVVLSILKKKLTPLAAIGGGSVGLVLYLGADITGLALLATFFLLGTAATAWKASAKQAVFNEEGDSPRHLGQVLANGGAAGLLGLAALLFPDYKEVFVVMIAGAFAAATADTLSSELGTVHGKRFYNILTFRKDQRGLDGVVSLEGFAIGMLGSAIIGIVYCVGCGWVMHFGGFLLPELQETLSTQSWAQHSNVADY